MESTSRQLWDIFWESPLSTYGIGGNRFKNPVVWTLLTKIGETVGDARNKVVFDVGCGTSVKSLLLALKGATVRGFDVDPRAIHNCHENLKKIEGDVDAKFFVWDVQKGFPAKYNKTVDFILCNQVIEHIQNYEKALDEMIRVLKPGGRIFITTPNKLTHRPKCGEKVYGEREHRHYHSFSRDDLKEAIKRRRNLEIEKITTHNPMPSLTAKTWYKIIAGMNSFHWLLQKIDEKRGTHALETIYVAVTKPIVMLFNSLVYPSILNSHLRGEERIKGDEGLTIYLILRKLAL